MDDPISHCLAELPAAQACRAPERRTWPGPLWQGCESRARRCTWCPRRTAPRRTWAWGADGRPLGRRYVRGGSAQKLDWLVVEEITQLDMALWADLACVGLNADVKFLLLGSSVGHASSPTRSHFTKLDAGVGAHVLRELVPVPAGQVADR